MAAVLAVVISLNLRVNTDPTPVFIKIWGVENKDAFDKVFSLYRQANPNVTIEYKEVSKDYFEGEVVNAMARGEGPDIFMVNNRNLYRSQDKLVPYGGLYPSNSPSAKNAFNIAALRNLFPSVAEQDFVRDGKIYGLPLYIDTLAMFYNRDLFDRASIVSPPRTWEDFKKVIPYLRSQNQNNQIVQAAAAIGGSEKTISYPANLVELLFIQNSESNSSDKDLDAFNYYLQFGNSGSTYYTWNEALGKDYELFLNNKLAITFGYYSDRKALLGKSPYLNMGVAKIPQVNSNSKTFADYWGLAVSKQSKVPEAAWKLVVDLTTGYPYAREYMNSASRIPALRQLIEENLNDPDKGVFVQQALTARAYPVTDGRAADIYINSAINKVVSGQADSYSALSEAKSKINLIKSGQ